jgi:hypothetical protein
MNDDQEPPPGPGETRAIELLRMVGTHTPEVRPGFSARVVSRARAQRAVAGPLRVLGGFIAAMAAAVSAAVRGAGSEGREP